MTQHTPEENRAYLNKRREINIAARAKDMTPKEVAAQIAIEDQMESETFANMTISEDTRKSAVRRREFWEEVKRRQSPVWVEMQGGAQ